MQDHVYIENAKAGQDVVVGHLIFAGEHVSEAYYSYMNGAAQTGRLAAQYLLKQLGAYQKGRRFKRPQGF